MSRAPAVAVLLVILLAGCNGFPGLGPAPTTTPTTTADGGPTTARPPGIAGSLVVDPSALAAAHADVISQSSYVVTANRTVRTANGSLWSSLRVRVALADDHTFLATARTAGPAAPVFIGEPPARAAYWSNGTTYLRRLHHDGRTTYTETGTPATWIGTWRYWAETVPFGGRTHTPDSFIESVFWAVPAVVTGRTTVDGVPVRRLEDQGDWPVADGAIPGRVRSISNVSLVALVDDRGLVRRLDLRYSGRIDGRPVAVHRTVRYTAVGSTAVDRPAWYGRAVSSNGSRHA